VVSPNSAAHLPNVRTFDSVVGTSIVEPKRKYYPVFANVQTAPGKYGECLSVSVCTFRNQRDCRITNELDCITMTSAGNSVAVEP